MQGLGVILLSVYESFTPLFTPYFTSSPDSLPRRDMKRFPSVTYLTAKLRKPKGVGGGRRREPFHTSSLPLCLPFQGTYGKESGEG